MHARRLLIASRLDLQIGPHGLEQRRLLDWAIRAGSRSRAPRRSRLAREWMLVDTRAGAPGEFVIRAWTDASGVTRTIEAPPMRRHGGAIGLFTLEPGCVTLGPCPQGVDEAAGLLLFGFRSMMAMPLPGSVQDDFEADWLVVLSGRGGEFDEIEAERLVLLCWALLDGPARRLEQQEAAPERRSRRSEPFSQCMRHAHAG